MDHNSHSNPYISIFVGIVFSLSTIIKEQPPVFIDFYDFLLQLMKVILFGLIGGACGKVGGILVMRFFKNLKDKCDES